MVFVFEDTSATPLPCFLIQAFITLALTRFLGKLVSYGKQPRVIGEIIGGLHNPRAASLHQTFTGILLGPSVLGQVPNFTSYIFPQYNVINGTVTSPPGEVIKSLDTFAVFANIGLILFLFLMGLELDSELLEKVWKKSIPIAGAPFSLLWS